MKSRTLAALFVPLLAFAAPMAAPSAQAQSVTIGNDDNQIIGVLRQNGFTQGRVVKRGLTIVRAEACRGAEKFQVKINVLGRITSTSKIGTCAVARAPTGQRFTRRQATEALQAEGFTQIDAQQQGRSVLALACKGDRRVELNFNRRGEIVNRRIVGDCSQGNVSQVAARLTEVLSERGFERVVVTDDQLPQYVAEACKDNERLRVTMNRRGIIMSERRIGDCRRQFNPQNIASMLERNGYERIKVVQSRRPPYQAQACKDGDKVDVAIGRFGRIRGEERTGSCATRINPADLASVVTKQGFDRVKILRGNRTPYLLEACKGNRLIELAVSSFGKIDKQDVVGRCASVASAEDIKKRYQDEGFVNVRLDKGAGAWNARMCRDEDELYKLIDLYGETLQERKTGTCKSKSVLNILKTLEKRGADKTQVNITGCFQGTQYRWSYDRLGNRNGRERIGSC